MTDDRCREIRELLAAFLDDELPCDVSHSIQEHLDECDGCRGFARMEESFTTLLKARLHRVEPAESLFERVRRRLDDPAALAGLPAEPGEPSSAPATAAERSSRPRWTAFRRAGFGLAAALVVAALLAPALEIYHPGIFQALTGSQPGVHRLPGVLVCAECDKEGVPIEMQRRCRAHGHQTGLRCPETGVWHLVVNDASRPVIADPEMRGMPVVVEGRLLRDIRYVDARAIHFVTGA